jgi:hypothetical protein
MTTMLLLIQAHVPHWPLWAALYLLVGLRVGYVLVRLATAAVKAARTRHPEVDAVLQDRKAAAVVGLLLGLLVLLTLPAWPLALWPLRRVLWLDDKRIDAAGARAADQAGGNGR